MLDKNWLLIYKKTVIVVSIILLIAGAISSVFLADSVLWIFGGFIDVILWFVAIALLDYLYFISNMLVISFMQDVRDIRNRICQLDKSN